MYRTMFFPVNKANVPHSFLKFLYEQIRRKWPDKCILQDDNTPQHTATHHNTPHTQPFRFRQFVIIYLRRILVQLKINKREGQKGNRLCLFVGKHTFSFARSKENYGKKIRADGRRTEVRLLLFVALNTSQMFYYSDDNMLSVTQYKLVRFKD